MFRSELPKFSYDLAVICALALLATILGLLSNRLRPDPLPWTYLTPSARLQQSVARLTPAANPVVQPAPETIDLTRFHDLVQTGTLVLDARPELFYRVGHVPGARSLSRATFEADYARLHTFLEPNQQKTVVIYCAGDECEDSRMVAAALQKLGYRQVLIYQGGWEEWRQAGLPEERSR